MYPEYQRCKVRAGSRTLLDPTPADIEGPFYLAGAPERASIADAPGDALTVSGRVLARSGSPITGAVLDVWQADPAGRYDLTGFRFRGKTGTGVDGGYQFSTVRPGDYDISEPTDPQPHEFRCAHIHVRVTAKGFKTLTTQLYFPDDEFNSTDHWFDARRVIRPPGWAFDFVLEAA